MRVWTIMDEKSGSMIHDCHDDPVACDLLMTILMDDNHCWWWCWCCCCWCWWWYSCIMMIVRLGKSRCAVPCSIVPFLLPSMKTMESRWNVKRRHQKRCLAECINPDRMCLFFAGSAFPPKNITSEKNAKRWWLGITRSLRCSKQTDFDESNGVGVEDVLFFCLSWRPCN